MRAGLAVVVYLADGGILEVGDFDPVSALDLKQAALAGEPWLTVDMDGDTVLVNSAQVVRIDFETA